MENVWRWAPTIIDGHGNGILDPTKVTRLALQNAAFSGAASAVS